MKKGTQLLEIYALEIQMYTAQVRRKMNYCQDFIVSLFVPQNKCNRATNSFYRISFLLPQHSFSKK